MSKKNIELYANTSQVMNDAIDRIVIEIHNKKKNENGAQKILLTGCGPQCGSTSISIALGISFAAAKWKTLIVDCDIRKAQELKKLNDDTTIGLSDYLLEEDKDKAFNFDEIIYGTNFDKVSYVPSGKFSASPARLFCSEMMKQFLQYANKNYDYVIFDFPSISVSPDAQILFKEVDGIVLISALEEVTKKQVKYAKHKVEPFADKYYGMIINKIDKDLYEGYVKRYDYYYLSEKAKQKLLKKVNKRAMSKKQKLEVGNEGAVKNEDKKKQ